MAIKSFTPKRILVNCPPEIAAKAASLKGDRSLTRYIVEAIDEKNRQTKRPKAKKREAIDVS